MKSNYNYIERGKGEVMTAIGKPWEGSRRRLPRSRWDVEGIEKTLFGAIGKLQKTREVISEA